MKTIFLTAISLLASASQAFVIPEGLGNGIYTVSADGEPVMIGNITERGLATRQAPLPNPKVSCGDGHFIDSTAHHNAFLNLANALDQGISYQPGTTVWTTYGTAVSYMCVYSRSSRGWRAELQKSNEMITSLCGEQHYGWVFISDYDKSYGRANSGERIC